MASLGMFVLKNAGVPALLCAAERVLLNKWFPFLAESVAFGLPRAYGLPLIVNLVGAAFFTTALGFKVGAARKDAIEKAKKEGDEHAEDRFSYPKMYAEGFSAEAKTFNCIQRTHQHCLESFTTVVACSLVGGLAQPVVTAVSGVFWMYSRSKWAAGYSTGEPANRYEKTDGWGRHIWTSMLWMLVCTISTALKVSGAY